MGNRVEGKIAIVTGAASGIGRITAQLLASEGASVGVLDLNAEGARAVAAEIEGAGGRALPVAVDVRDEVQIQAAIASVLHEFGRLDILHINAGVHIPGPLHTFSARDIDFILQVNLRGALLCAKYGVEPMLEQRGGSIIFTSSVAAIRGRPGQSVYSASKGALISAARAMAVDYAPANVRVNTVAPGFILTPINVRLMEDPAFKARTLANHPLGLGQPGDIAAAVLYLGSDEAHWITGTTLTVDGGDAI